MAAPRLLLALLEAFDMAVARAEGGKRGVLAEGGAGSGEEEKEVLLALLVEIAAEVGPPPPPPKRLPALVGLGVAADTLTLLLEAFVVVDCEAPVCEVEVVVWFAPPPPLLPVELAGTLAVVEVLEGAKVEEGFVELLVLLDWLL